jgi:glycerol uptake facilitator-like aquaporin
VADVVRVVVMAVLAAMAAMAMALQHMNMHWERHQKDAARQCSCHL